ncbi:MAG: C40 family peptidase [Phenylobacterium sp.]|uniref:C40 family peptidase n=1 Tax=Phenylobacterium sp. TaxID=1871053 RepID=UPI00391A6FCB
MSHDPRTTLARPDLAARSLEGVLPAGAYADPALMVCAAPSAAIRRAPHPDAEQLDQLLFGEVFEVLETEGGFSWGQARRDGYVGFVEAAALAPAGAAPTHRLRAIRTYAFAEPSIKSRALGPYSLNALVVQEGREGRFLKAAGGGWFVDSHLAPIGEAFESDPAAVVERFVGAPYLWGGRESLGLDCSGLVQQALYACGRACPRDTDQQEAAFASVARADLTRGDLVFWRGHVGMMVDSDRLIHANAHHMAVTVEPLDEVAARVLAAEGREPTSYRRP